MKMAPSLTSSSPAMQRRSVVFPQPDGSVLGPRGQAEKPLGRALAQVGDHIRADERVADAPARERVARPAQGGEPADLRESPSERLLCLALRADVNPIRFSLDELGCRELEPLVGAACGSEPQGVVSLPSEGPSFHVWRLSNG